MLYLDHIFVTSDSPLNTPDSPLNGISKLDKARIAIREISAKDALMKKLVAMYSKVRGWTPCFPCMTLHILSVCINCMFRGWAYIGFACCPILLNLSINMFKNSIKLIVCFCIYLFAFELVCFLIWGYRQIPMTMRPWLSCWTRCRDWRFRSTNFTQRRSADTLLFPGTEVLFIEVIRTCLFRNLVWITVFCWFCASWRQRCENYIDSNIFYQVI